MMGIVSQFLTKDPGLFEMFRRGFFLPISTVHNLSPFRPVFEPFPAFRIFFQFLLVSSQSLPDSPVDKPSGFNAGVFPLFFPPKFMPVHAGPPIMNPAGGSYAYGLPKLPCWDWNSFPFKRPRDKRPRPFVLKVEVEECRGNLNAHRIASPKRP